MKIAVGGFALAGVAGLALAMPQIEVAGYEKWTPLRDKELVVLDPLMLLCRTLTPEESKALAESPHAKGKVQTFANPIAVKAAKAGTRLPVGSILVKRKRSDAGQVLGATVMIKREKGFFPDAGDWEFATLSADGSKYTSRGKIQSCVTCHRGGAAWDYLLGHYARRK